MEVDDEEVIFVPNVTEKIIIADDTDSVHDEDEDKNDNSTDKDTKVNGESIDEENEKDENIESENGNSVDEDNGKDDEGQANSMDEEDNLIIPDGIETIIMDDGKNRPNSSDDETEDFIVPHDSNHEDVQDKDNLNTDDDADNMIIPDNFETSNKTTQEDNIETMERDEDNIPDESDSIIIEDECGENMVIPDESEGASVPNQCEPVNTTEDDAENITISHEVSHLPIPNQKDKLLAQNESESITIVDEENEQIIPDESEGVTILDERNGELTIVGAKSKAARSKENQELHFNKRLIKMVKLSPELFDRKHKDFSKAAAKDAAWMKIADRLKGDAEICKNTWADLRFEYQRYVRRLRKFLANGNKLQKRRPIMAYENEMMFLWRFVADRSIFPVPHKLTQKEIEDGKVAVPEEPQVEDDDIVLVEDEPVIIVVDDEESEKKKPKALDNFVVTDEMRKLVEHVQEYPELYDPTHMFYNDYRRKGIIWNAISNELGDKATKLMKYWIYVQTRYEWVVCNQSKLFPSTAEAKEQMAQIHELLRFLIPHTHANQRTVYKQSYYLKQQWHEPIDNFKSIFNLLGSLKKFPTVVSLTDELLNVQNKDSNYFSLWGEVARSRGVVAGQCETTWLLLRSFYWELMNMRKQSYQFQDKWYFENIITELYNLAAPAKKDAPQTIITPSATTTKTVTTPATPVTKTIIAPASAVPIITIPDEPPAKKYRGPGRKNAPVANVIEKPKTLPTVNSKNTNQQSQPTQRPQQYQVPQQVFDSQQQYQLPQQTQLPQVSQIHQLPHHQVMPHPQLPQVQLPPGVQRPVLLNTNILPQSALLNSHINQSLINEQVATQPLLSVQITTSENTIPKPTPPIQTQSLIQPRTFAASQHQLPTVRPQVAVQPMVTLPALLPKPPAPVSVPPISVQPSNNSSALVPLKTTLNGVVSTTTSSSTPADGASSALNSNEIMVELIGSNFGNQLVVHGPPLTEKYSLSMAKTTAFIREIMSIPLLHNKRRKNNAEVNVYWQYLSMKFNLPTHICRACWNFLHENFGHFPQIAPMEELMKPTKTGIKVWKYSTDLFVNFQADAVRQGWNKYMSELPDLMEEIGKHNCLYGYGHKSPSTVSALRALKVKFPNIENILGIWVAVKSIFNSFMDELENGTFNTWPEDWWRVFAKLKFLIDTRYNTQEPFFYIVRHKFIEEINRCSLYELKVNKAHKRVKVVAEAPDIVNSVSASSTSTPVSMSPVTVDSPVEQPIVEQEDVKPFSDLTNVDAYALVSAIRHHPGVYTDCDEAEKTSAWQALAEELNSTVKICRSAFKRVFMLYCAYKTSQKNGDCHINKEYFKHLDEIYRKRTIKLTLNIKTPSQLNQSFTDATASTESHHVEHYMPEINLSNSKPALAIKNLAYAAENVNTKELSALLNKYRVFVGTPS